jgi:hypothetical protein
MPGAATGSARCATSAELGDDSRPTPPPMSRYKQPTPARHSRIAQPRNCPGRLQPVQALRRHPTGFFEKIGWCGYLPPKLATGYPRLAPALVGLLHGIWHLPLMLLTTARVRDQHRFGRTDPQYRMSGHFRCTSSRPCYRCCSSGVSGRNQAGWAMPNGGISSAL